MDNQEIQKTEQPQGPTLKEKTAKGLFWGGISNVVQQIIQLIFGVLMGRILFPEDFGLVGMLSIFTVLANYIQESGFSLALINKREISHVDYSSVFWFNIISSIVLYFLLFCLSPLIADYFDQPQLIALSRIVFLSFIFSSIGIVPNSILIKEIETKKLAYVNAGSVLISCLIGLTFALLNYSYWAIAIQMIAFSFSKTVLLFLYNNWRPTKIFKVGPIKEMYSFSVKILLANLVNVCATNISSVLLGRYYDEDQVGYYSQATKWHTIPFSIVYGIANTTSYPVLANASSDLKRQQKVFRKMLRFISFISFPLILGFGFVAPELIPILVTDKWAPSVPIIQILCIWGMFMPIQGLYSNLFVTRGHSNIHLGINVFVGVILICTLVLLVQNGIIVMLKASVIVNFTCYLFVSLWIAKKKFGFKIIDFIKDVFPFLCITIFIFGIVHLIVINFQNIYSILFVKISMSVILYILMMKLLKIIIFQEAFDYIVQKIKSII